MGRFDSTPQRAYVTDHLLEQIRASLTAYSYDKPENTPGGWTDDPSKPTSRYVPYSIIEPLQAVASEGSVGRPATIWTLPYSLTSYGVTGTQAERQSDKLRKLVCEIENEVVLFGSDQWKILRVTCPRIGQVMRNRSGVKPIYEQNDTAQVQISKE